MNNVQELPVETIEVEKIFFYEGLKCYAMKYIASKTGFKYGFISHRFGYVVIPENNSLINYNDSDSVNILSQFDVFGGVTFIGTFQVDDVILNPGKFYFPPSSEFLFGFDCAHGNKVRSLELYDLQFVKNELCKLAKQILKFNRF